MLSLDSPKWSELSHAYGSASDMPALIRQLDDFPSARNNAEPWYSIWSALAHQGDVYSASFAAVPHVVRAISIAPTRASNTYFQFPTWVEICRHRHGIQVPENLLPAYSEALNMLPELVCAAAARDWDDDFLVCALSSFAVAKQSPRIAEAILEFTPETVKEFLDLVHGD
jgi:hypothetical protein